MQEQKKIEQIVKNHWEQMVDGLYFYHGISLSDVNLSESIALDRAKNSLENIIPVFMQYSKLL